jgi:hypothetical protein
MTSDDYLNYFIKNEAGTFDDPSKFDTRLGEIRNAYIEEQEGKPEDIDNKLRQFRQRWYADKELDPTVKANQFQLEPINLKTSSIEDVAAWERKQIDNVSKTKTGFLYKDTFALDLRQEMTQMWRQKEAEENEPAEPRSAAAELLHKSADLGLRFFEGFNLTVGSVFDRDGSVNAETSRQFSTDPKYDSDKTSLLAGGAGSIVPSVGIAVGGGIIGTAVAGPAGAATGGYIGGTAASVGFNMATRANEAYKTTLSLTNDTEKAFDSWSGQIPAVAVDTLSDLIIGRFLKPITGMREAGRMNLAAREFRELNDLGLDFAERSAKQLKIVRKYGKDIMYSGIEGGLGEAVAEPLGDVLAAYGLDPNIRDASVQTAIENIPTSAALGFILGGAASGGMNALQGNEYASPLKIAVEEDLGLDKIIDQSTGVFLPADTITENIKEHRKARAETTAGKSDEEVLATANAQNQAAQVEATGNIEIPDIEETAEQAVRNLKIFSDEDENDLTLEDENDIPTNAAEPVANNNAPEGGFAPNSEENSVEADDGLRTDTERSEEDLSSESAPTETVVNPLHKEGSPVNLVTIDVSTSIKTETGRSGESTGFTTEERAAAYIAKKRAENPDAVIVATANKQDGINQEAAIEAVNRLNNPAVAKTEETNTEELTELEQVDKIRNEVSKYKEGQEVSVNGKNGKVISTPAFAEVGVEFEDGTKIRTKPENVNLPVVKTEVATEEAVDPVDEVATEVVDEATTELNESQRSRMDEVDKTYNVSVENAETYRETRPEVADNLVARAEKNKAASRKDIIDNPVVKAAPATKVAKKKPATKVAKKNPAAKPKEQPVVSSNPAGDTPINTKTRRNTTIAKIYDSGEKGVKYVTDYLANDNQNQVDSELKKQAQMFLSVRKEQKAQIETAKKKEEADAAITEARFAKNEANRVKKSNNSLKKSRAEQRASELLDSDNSLIPTLVDIVNGIKSRLPAPPIGFLNKIKNKRRYSPITDKEKSLLDKWSGIDSYLPQSAFGNSFNGKVAQALHRRIFSVNTESTSKMDDLTSLVSDERDFYTDDAYAQVMEELTRVANGEAELVNPVELRAEQLYAFEDATAEPLNSKNKKRVSVEPHKLQIGDEIVVNGETLTVSDLKNDEDGDLNSVVFEENETFGEMAEMFFGQEYYVDSITQNPENFDENAPVFGVDGQVENDLTLEAQTEEEITADKKAAKSQADMQKGIEAPLAGKNGQVSTGDMTADMFGDGDTPLFNERRDNKKAEPAQGSEDQKQDAIKSVRKALEKTEFDIGNGKTDVLFQSDVIEDILAGLESKEGIVNETDINSQLDRFLTKLIETDPDAAHVFRESLDALLSRKNPNVTSGKAVTQFEALPESQAVNPKSFANTLLRLKNNGKPVLYGRHKNKAIQKLVSLTEKIFNTEVVFFSGQINSNLPDGFYDTRSNTVYINIDNQRPIPMLLGHEGAHALEFQNPELWTELKSKLGENDAFGKFYQQYAKSLGKRGYSENQFLREFMADIVGRSFENSAALGRLQALLGPKNTGLFNKILEWIKNIVTPLNNQLRTLIAEWQTNGDIDALNALENQVQGLKTIEDVLRINAMTGTQNNPVFVTSAANNTDARLTAVTRSTNGDPHPQITAFLESKKNRLEGAEDSINRPQDENGRYSIKIKEYDAALEAKGLKSSDPIVQRFFKGKPTRASLNSFIQHMQTEEGVAAISQMSVDTLTREYQYSVSDASFMVGSTIYMLITNRLAKFGVNFNDRVDFVRQIQEMKIAGRFQAEFSYDGTTGLGATAISILQHWRSDTGGLGATINSAARSNMTDAIGGKDVAKRLDDQLFPTGYNGGSRTADGDNSIKEAQKKVAKEMGDTEIDPREAELMKKGLLMTATTEKVILRFKTMVNFLRSGGNESKKAPQTLDELDAYLDEMLDDVDKIKNSKTLAEIMAGNDKLTKALDELDLTEITRNVTPEQKVEIDGARKEVKETRKKISEAIIETEGEFSDDPATSFLVGKITSNENTIANAENLRNVTDMAKVFSGVTTRIAAGEMTVQEGIVSLLNDELFAEVEETIIEEALTTDVGRRKVMADAKTYASDRKRVDEAEKRSIMARAALNKTQSVSKNKSLSEVALRFEKGEITFNEAVAELQKTFPDAPVDEINTFLNEASRTLQAKASKNLEPALLKNIVQTMNTGEKILRLLGVGDFFYIVNDTAGRAAWVDLTTAAKRNRIKEQTVVNPNLLGHIKTKADEDVLIAMIDNTTEENSHELSAFVMRQKKELATPKRKSFWKAFQEILDNSDEFYNLEPSEKLASIKKWIAEEMKDPLMAAAFQREIDSGTKSTNSIANKMLRRFDEVTSNVANDTSGKVIEALKKGGGIGKLSQKVLFRAIKLKLLNNTLSMDFALAKQYGSGYVISPEAQVKLMALIKRIEDSERDNSNRFLSKPNVDKLKGQMSDILQNESPNWSPNALNIIRGGLQGFLYSGPATWFGVQVGAGVSAVASQVTREILTRIASQTKMKVKGQKSGVGFAADILNVTEVMLAQVGIKMNDFQVEGQYENAFMRWTESLINGGEQSDFVTVDALNNTREGQIMRDELHAHFMRVGKRIINIRKLLSEVKNGKMGLRQTVRLTKDVLLMMPAASFLVFRVMGSIDSMFNTMMTNMTNQFQIQRWIRTGGLTPKIMADSVKELAGKAESYNRYLETEHPEMSPRARKLIINEKINQDLFVAFSENGIEAAADAARVSNIEAVSSTGNTSERIGVFGELLAMIRSATDDFMGNKDTDSSTARIMGSIIKIVTTITPFLTTASVVADKITWSIPGVGALIAWKLNNTSNINPDAKSFYGRVKYNYSKLYASEYQKEQRHMSQVLSIGVTLALFAMLRGDNDDEEDEKMIEVFLNYPKDQKERNRWSRDKEITEYSTRIKLPGGNKLVLEHGRGIFQQITGPLVVAKRLESIIRNRDAETTKEQLGSVVFDVSSNALPFVSSLLQQNSAFERGDFTSLPDRVIANAIPNGWKAIDRAFWTGRTTKTNAGVIQKLDMRGRTMDQMDTGSIIRRLGMPISVFKEKDYRDLTPAQIKLQKIEVESHYTSSGTSPANTLFKGIEMLTDDERNMIYEKGLKLLSAKDRERFGIVSNRPEDLSFEQFVNAIYISKKDQMLAESVVKNFNAPRKITGQKGKFPIASIAQVSKQLNTLSKKTWNPDVAEKFERATQQQQANFVAERGAVTKELNKRIGLNVLLKTKKGQAILETLEEGYEP